MALAEIESDQELAEREQEGRDNGPDRHVSPRQIDRREDLEDHTEQSAATANETTLFSAGDHCPRLPALRSPGPEHPGKWSLAAPDNGGRRGE